MSYRYLVPIVLAALLAASACGKKTEEEAAPAPPRVQNHEQTTISDADVLAEAKAATAEVVQNQTDCAKALPAAAEAKVALADAGKRVQSAAGKMTVET